MPRNLKRIYEPTHLHFITFSCYRRLPLLRTARRRDVVLLVLEEVRQKYHFPILGYVIMPEHVHLLIGPPEQDDLSVVLKVIKQTSARYLLPRGTELQHYWQKRFYDFNVYSDRKRVEKLRYIHRNPVKRGLVEAPEQWKWSSFRFYWLDEAGPVKISRFEELISSDIPLIASR